ncbi:isoaspartyl peptidase/L-asparaginase [Brachybacterium huguangmaarense]
MTSADQIRARHRSTRGAPVYRGGMTTSLSPELRHPSVSTFTAPPSGDGTCLVIHGGAGGRLSELALGGPTSDGGSDAGSAWADGLRAAHEAGERVLRAGGSALDAVCASVAALEDDPLFNAGRGAALTASGRAELDASVMTGEGGAGAVAAVRTVRHPVLLARAVMERTDHVLLAAPDESLADAWGLERVDPAFFVTPARERQLADVLARRAEASRHGTVGAVAIDTTGRIAAATSTGGMVGQADGRVGDSPLIGAGTFARDGIAGVSCTGMGEAFIRGAVAHEVCARIVHAGTTLRAAVEGTIAAELGARGAEGGIIAAGAGGIVAAHNSPAMFAAFRDGEELVVLT